MRKITKFIALTAVVMMALSSCVRVRQGERALKVHELGEKKGEIEVLGPGRYSKSIVNRFRYEIYPTTLQQHSWISPTDHNGNKTVGEIVYQSEGERVSADIGIEFTFPSSDDGIVSFYRKYRRTPDEFVDEYLQKDVRSAFNKVVESMPIEYVYSVKKDSIRQEVHKILIEKYAQEGVDISEVTYLSNVFMSKVVQDAITEKLKAKQRAEMRENEVAEAEAEARKKVAAAEGEAQSLIKQAEGRARAMDVEGKALSRNPQVLRLKELEMQTELAKSAANWQYVNFTGQQAGQLLNMPTK